MATKKSRRGQVIGVRFSNQEIQTIKKLAKKYHLKRSTFIRSTVLKFVDVERLTKISQHIEEHRNYLKNQ